MRDATSEKQSTFRRIFAWAGGYIGCAAILSTVLGGAIGFGFGLLYAEGQAKMQKYLDEREAVEPIIASDPAFRELKTLARSIGGIELIGTVPQQADHERLRNRLVQLFGEKRAAEIIRPVCIDK